MQDLYHEQYSGSDYRAGGLAGFPGMLAGRFNFGPQKITYLNLGVPDNVIPNPYFNY